jgi:MFS family permease
MSHTTVYIILLAAVAAIGGFLFGYDTEVISGALLYLKSEFNLDHLLTGAVTAAVLGGATASGAFADFFGRRIMLVFDAVLFLTALAQGVWWLVIGRFMVGLGIGIASYTSPLYISESAPAKTRGALVSANQLMITIGIVVS